MIAKLVICAAALLLAPAPAAQQKPAEAGKPQVEQPKAVEKSSTLELLPIEENVIKFTNAERVKQGLHPLEVDASLMKSARRHASWMAQNRNMVHTRQSVAENIAMGQPNSGDGGQRLDEFLGTPCEHSQPRTPADRRGRVSHRQRDDLLVPAVLALNQSPSQQLLTSKIGPGGPRMAGCLR